MALARKFRRAGIRTGTEAYAEPKTTRDSVKGAVRGPEKSAEHNDKEALARQELMLYMLKELYERMSGIASEGLEYAFGFGADAGFLMRMKGRAAAHDAWFPAEDLRRVFGIYEGCFRYDDQRKLDSLSRRVRALPAQ